MPHAGGGHELDPEAGRTSTGGVVDLFRVQEEPFVPGPDGAIARGRRHERRACRPVDDVAVAVRPLIPHHLAEPAGTPAEPGTHQAISHRPGERWLAAQRRKATAIWLEHQRRDYADGRVGQRREHLPDGTRLENQVRVEDSAPNIPRPAPGRRLFLRHIRGSRPFRCKSPQDNRGPVQRWRPSSRCPPQWCATRLAAAPGQPTKKAVI